MSTPGHSPDAKREFILASLRRSSACLRSSAYELDEIGIALRHNIINAEGVVTWLAYVGALHVINAEPWTNRVEVAA